MISFTIVDPHGKEEPGVGDGVVRDVYASFWKAFADSNLIGEQERVPFVRHDYYKNEWSVVGQIIAKGFKDINYFPVVLSKAFMSYCLFGEVTDQELLASFKKYLSHDEATVVENVLNGLVEVQSDELMELLDHFKCRTLVKKENVRSVLIELARQELIQKPHLMASEWREVIGFLKQEVSSPSALDTVYQKLYPSSRKVLSLIKANPENDGQRESLSYLKRYIRGLNDNQVKIFLVFCTGSDIINVDSIEISFVQYDSTFQRRPIARTCAPMLQLPANYNNFCELREDFTSILSHSNLGIDFV